MKNQYKSLMNSILCNKFINIFWRLIRIIKYEVYEEAGVKDYWIVSPQDKTFLKYTLINDAYHLRN